MEDAVYTMVQSRVRIDNLTLTVLREKTLHRNEIAKEPFHSHSYTELFFCLSGVLSVCTDSEMFHICPGEILLIPPHILHHSFQASENDNFIAIGLLAELDSGYGGNDLYSLTAPILNEAVRLYKDTSRIYSLLTEILDNSDPMKNAYLTSQFLYRFSALPYVAASEVHFTRKSDPNVKDYDRILRLETLINSMFNQDLTLENMASFLYISKRQLARIVNKYYGVPLHKIIMRKRMEAASKLLISTTVSAELIGQKVGYQSKSSFYREFNEYFGTTPTKYRHMNRR